MRKKICFILIAICMLPMTVLASKYVSGTSANDYFGTLTDIIYDNSSSLAVSDEPGTETIFPVEETTRITGIWTYHWNVSDYSGATIKLINIDTNTEYGPWDVVTDGGSGRDNVNWYVFPNVVIPAGRYKLVDSHNDTWSYASDTNNKGISTVKGSAVEHIGDVTINGSALKPVVDGTPYNLTGYETEKFKVVHQIWTEAGKSGVATKFSDGKEYLYQLNLEPKDGYYFDENDKVTVTGVVWDNPYTYFDNNVGYAKEGLRYRGVTWAYSTEYQFIEGANLSTRNINEFVFKIDADFSKFSDGGKVYIGISGVPSNMYTAESGSTIITLNPEYVKYIPVGEMKSLRVLFNDGGAAITNFTRLSNSVPEDGNPGDGEKLEPENTITDPTEEVIPKEENPGDGDKLELENTINDSKEEVTSKVENPGDGDKLELENTINDSKEKVTSKVENPQTGDNITISIILGILSVMGIAGVSIYTKKRFN